MSLDINKKNLAIFATIGLFALILSLYVVFQEMASDHVNRNNIQGSNIDINSSLKIKEKNHYDQEKSLGEYKNIHSDSVIQVERISLEEFQRLSDENKANFIANLDDMDRNIFESILSSDKYSVFLKNLVLQKISYFAVEGEDVSGLIEIGLNDPNEDVRECAMSIIDAVESREVQLDILLTAIKSNYTDNRIRSVKYVIEINLPKEYSGKLLLSALHDAQSEVRQWALATASLLFDKDFTTENEAIAFLNQ